MSTVWVQQTQYPKYTRFSQPFPLNKTEFFVVGSNRGTMMCDGIYKYNINTNKWSRIFEYDADFTLILYSAAYDSQQQIVYVYDQSVYDSQPQIISFNLKSKKMKSISKVSQSGCQFTQIWAGCKLHRIMNTYSAGGCHLAYDSEAQKFKTISHFEAFQLLYSHSLIYLPKNKSIFSFGGVKRSTVVIDETVLSAIYRFSFDDSKWQQLSIEIPMKLLHVAVAATRNERYIILFGGDTFADQVDGDIFTDNIFIYDTKKNTFTTSKVKCPLKSCFHALFMHDSIRDNVTSVGFVRDCFKRDEYIAMQPLPEYLIKIIVGYFCREQIYLIERFKGTQWKIDIDLIFAD